jgi:hypothetical protein
MTGPPAVEGDAELLDGQQLVITLTGAVADEQHFAQGSTTPVRLPPWADLTDPLAPGWTDPKVSRRERRTRRACHGQ